MEGVVETVHPPAAGGGGGMNTIPLVVSPAPPEAPPAEARATPWINAIPPDVMSIVILYTLGGYMRFDLSNHGLYANANNKKNAALRQLRCVNRHFWRCVTHYVLRNTNHTIVYNELAMLYYGSTDEALVTYFGDAVLLKLCENEAGKIHAKQSLLATFYLYVTGQCARYFALSGYYNKQRRERIQTHFKKLCLNKRGEFRVAFRVLSDAIQWVQDSQQARKVARFINDTNAQLARHQEVVDRLTARRDKYETDRVAAEKRETESKQRLDERVKRLKKDV